MVPKRIDHRALEYALDRTRPYRLVGVLLKRARLGSPCSDCPRLHFVRVADEQLDSHRCVADPVGSTCSTTRCLLGKEELGAMYRATGDNVAGGVNAPQFNGTQRHLVESIAAAPSLTASIGEICVRV